VVISIGNYTGIINQLSLGEIMKKNLFFTIVLLLVIQSAIFASELFPSTSSSSNYTHQVIGNVFYIGTMNSDISASSIGVGASYHNKLSDNIGIYANGGVGKPLSFKFSGYSNLTDSVVVFLQSGPYYKIDLPYENMSVKVGCGLDLGMYGGKLSGSGQEVVAVSLGIGALGSYEYQIVDMLTLVGSLNFGVDFATWKTNTSTDEFERADIGSIITVMPSIGVSYSY
jgi:hypothetical protein